MAISSPGFLPPFTKESSSPLNPLNPHHRAPVFMPPARPSTENQTHLPLAPPPLEYSTRNPLYYIDIMRGVGSVTQGMRIRSGMKGNRFFLVGAFLCGRNSAWAVRRILSSPSKFRRDGREAWFFLSIEWGHWPMRSTGTLFIREGIDET